jgi:hypothetical protein
MDEITSFLAWDVDFLVFLESRTRLATGAARS